MSRASLVFELRELVREIGSFVLGDFLARRASFDATVALYHLNQLGRDVMQDLLVKDFKNARGKGVRTVGKGKRGHSVAKIEGGKFLRVYQVNVSADAGVRADAVSSTRMTRATDPSSRWIRVLSCTARPIRRARQRSA